MWGKILTVRASCVFGQTSDAKEQPPHCNPLVLSRLVLSLLYARVLSRTGARWSAVVVLLLVGGCCGCQDGGEVVRGGGAAARRWLLWMSGRGEVVRGGAAAARRWLLWMSGRGEVVRGLPPYIIRYKNKII